MVKKVFVKVLGILLIIIGIGLFFYPDISEWYLDWQTAQYIDDFQKRYEEKHAQSFIQSEETAAFLQKTEDPLYQEVFEYNREIYESGQEGFRDAWSYEQTPISLNGLEDGKFGYIEIPSIDVALSLYVGASGTNMSKGAAVLGQTSIPIGGKNTNSVIAAHRGWSTGSFLRDVEDVCIGDEVYITNPWERLAYQVESIDIINPDDIDAVMIQEGKDMITICTCHPYMSQGKYRYLLYCVRDEDEERILEERTQVSELEASLKTKEEIAISETDAKEEGYIIASDGTAYESSDNAIQRENLVRRGSALAIILIVLVSLVYAGNPGARRV